MVTLSALLAPCEGNQGPSSDVFLNVNPGNVLNKIGSMRSFNQLKMKQTNG